MITLYGYWRSSASYRVRIALALKGLDYDYIPVNLLKGEQRDAAYLAINPLALVPSLKTTDGAVLTQSLAIIEYLEEQFPSPSLLPRAPEKRAKARAAAATIACEAQPFMNLRTQQYLKKERGFQEADMEEWLARFTMQAMLSVEKTLADEDGTYCIGTTPTIADVFLVPQIFGAKRFGIALEEMPRLNEVYERCVEHPAFIKAHPENQPDAVMA